MGIQGVKACVTGGLTRVMDERCRRLESHMDGAVRKVPDLYREIAWSRRADPHLLHDHVVPDDIRNNHLAVDQLNSEKIGPHQGALVGDQTFLGGEAHNFRTNGYHTLVHRQPH